MTKFATTATELSYPPLEGEGRSLWTKRSFVQSDRGGVIVHPQLIRPALAASHPTPSRKDEAALRPSAPTLPLQGRVRKCCRRHLFSYAVAVPRALMISAARIGSGGSTAFLSAIE